MALEDMKPDFSIEKNPGSDVKHMIGIVSGKGGVGKSLVTSQLNNLMRKSGFETGILDADITGPSIPKMFGVSGPCEANEKEWFPVSAEDGTKIMSINLLLQDEEQPVIWRGPVIAGTLKQFWTDVNWGRLDYLFVDMPPGTGDVPLTAFQSLPLDGIIVVTSPQELVGLIVQKAVNMAAMMDVPVLGVVENYSYFKCPGCGQQHAIFGESHIADTVAKLHVPLLAQLPMEPEAAKAADAGKVHDYLMEELAPAKAVLENL